jgi:hypothetical protein
LQQHLKSRHEKVAFGVIQRVLMFVDYSDEIPPGRHHPWTPVENNPEAKYYDFKTHPEQIPLVLEDFKPWAHYPAIPRFYELLRWLNGRESILESNDCGLRPPRRDQATPDVVRHVFDSDPIDIPTVEAQGILFIND